jgi:hypothetical protein
MTGEKGNELAIREAIERWDDDERADQEERQFGLFGEPQTEGGKAKLIAFHRGPGRPPGSRNKRTEKTVAFLMSRYRDPRAVLLEIAQANVGDLAALLGCSLFEAAQEKRLCAIGVLPYVQARITPEVIDNRQVINLTIHTGSPGVPASQTLHVLDPDEYEEVISGADDGAHANDDGSTDEHE